MNTNVIYFKSYTKNYNFLSNFYSSTIVIDNKKYYHVEGFYQASKFFNNNYQIAEIICLTKNPKDAKRLSRSCLLSKNQIIEWNNKKVDIMKRAVLYKFLGNIELQNALLATQNSELIEWSLYDSYWGIGKDGTGQNILGRILMDIRHMILTGTIDFTLL